MNKNSVVLALLLSLCSTGVAEGQALDTSFSVKVRVRKTSTGKASVTTSILGLKPDTVVVTRVDTVRISTGVQTPCRDSLLGPYVDDGYPSTYLDQSAFTACGKFLGRVLSSDGLSWTAVPWHAAYPAKRFTSNRQALLYLEGRNTEQPLP